MTDEHITGYFLRVQRDGRWVNTDVAAMTDAELHAHFDREESLERLRNWSNGLANLVGDLNLGARIGAETDPQVLRNLTILLAGLIRDHMVDVDGARIARLLAHNGWS